jgi:hypothetical protein
MKAEHRKELQTNVLADRMGRLVREMKTGSRTRRRIFWILGGVILVVLVFGFFLRIRATHARSESDLWVEFEDGAQSYINKLVEGPDWIRLSKQVVKEDRYGKTAQGKAARFQNAWYFLWELGVKILAADPGFAVQNLNRAELMYSVLANDCKDDPVYLPEALYALALIEETKAVQDSGDGKDRARHLAEAGRLYDELADKHKDSAHGKMAAERALLLKKDSPTYNEIARFYQDFQTTHKIQPPRKDLPKDLK